MFVAISPRDERVGLVEGQSVTILNREQDFCGKISAASYLARYPDTAFVELASPDKARTVLEEYEANSLSLDMMLLLFDRDVTISTRMDLARELDSLFQEERRKDYVLDIVLSKPLPKTADVGGAMDAAASFPVTREVLKSIIDCQDRVRSVFESWLSISQEQIVRQNGAERVFGVLCRYGVFRLLALKATDSSELRSIKSVVVLNTDMSKTLDSASRIVSRLIESLQKKIPKGEHKPAVSRRIPYDELSSEAIAEPKNELPRHSTPHAAYSAALSQIEKISDLYIQERDPQADSILNQLIEEHSKHSNGEEYVVKSLTNIAQKVGSAGRPEVGLNCLQRALDFKGGIDAILYLNIGIHLRENGQFDEALNCYELAKQLDDGTLADRIRMNSIHVTVARGNYERAVSEYLAIPDLQIKPHGLVRLGTLYRKMGRLKASRKAYQSCLEIDPEIHAAYAGLAEIRKQSGKPHLAIAEYNRILKQFDEELDNGPRKVYRLALSYLFRLTQQYENAEHVLQALAKDFPGDRGMHLQYAKLFEVQKKHEQAEAHFRKATGHSFRELGQLIFAKARNLFQEDLVNENIESIPGSLMPDESGLTTCFEAYTLIKISEYEKAKSLLDKKPSIIDRMTKDYSEVLRFHAMKRISSGFSYKSEHNMCRVAKGAFRTLRQAMQLIQNEDFSTAEQLEAEFLQRIAA